MNDQSNQDLRQKGDRMAADYRALVAIRNAQKRTLNLYIAILAALGVILLFLGLSNECLQEIHILLGGVALTGVFYSTRSESGGAPGNDPDWP